MKLHADTNLSLNTVTAYGAGYVEVNRQRYDGAVAFSPEGEVAVWEIASIAQLTSAHLLEAIGVAPGEDDPFAALDDEPSFAMPAQGGTEVLLVGTGARQHFLRPDVLRPVLRAGVGVEVMDTQAAARTYNILMTEGRHVAVVLLPA
ncbi:hypothetical protein FOZ76_20755 [Verticiella sediminum]|uniref:Xcc1710-like domain-containing protein n=1 Tax=Verticiella sediminum TaxID=1247510 RepID=A0A556ABM7_9BURK|nr:Mth938-like domain-containing protein [Verticiella sediminum]TSH90267.1 hypothetical protein FOZ76_20755 [Verticiella sediminum]